MKETKSTPCGKIPEPNPRISVVIPTYNRAYCLKRAVDSVFSQDYQNLEVIVVDDGSDDDTPAIIDSMQKQRALYFNLRYIPIIHAGVSRARNTGIRAAAGEWIAFLDSDDYWLEGKLKKQLNYLSKKKEYRICHTDEIWIKNGRRINQGKKHRKYEGWFFSPSLHLCLISPSSVLIHKDVFSEVGLFDESFPYVEDFELWLRITARFTVGFINEKLVVKTGGHSDQLSKRISGIEKYRMQALKKLILNGFFDRERIEEAATVYFRKAEIYIEGCERRGKSEEIARIRQDIHKVALRANVNLLQETTEA